MSQAGFCAESSAPFVLRGLQRRSQSPDVDVVRVGDRQGAWEEEGESAMPLAADAPLLSQASGRLCLCCCRGIKRDEKFCMGECGERRRQSRLVCA